jgi:signal transduction histidine kinase
MKLSSKVNKLFLGSIIAVLAIGYTAYFILKNAHKSQSFKEQKEQLVSLLEKEVPYLTQEIINESFYAVKLRGENIFNKNSNQKLQMGIYRANGDPIFVTKNADEVFHNGQLKENQSEKYVSVNRDIEFAGNIVARIVLAEKFLIPSSNHLSKSLYVSMIFLIFTIVLIFIFIRISLFTNIIRPIEKITYSIPNMLDFLSGEKDLFCFPEKLGSEELNRVSETLKTVTQKARQLIDERNLIENEINKNVARNELASQVAHDIRSPLAALNMVIRDIQEIPEEKRIIIRGSVNRIQDIANDLLAKNRELKNNKTVNSIDMQDEYEIQLISSLLDSIVTEKRMQFRSKLAIEIEFLPSNNAYGLFAKIQPHGFKRVISNIVNNAVEALGDSGKVQIELSGFDQKIQIKVKDDGKGIPAEILAKLGKSMGETHDKVDGNGLGLYHAKKSVELWGGSLEIESIVNTGTTLSILIPKTQAPSWFVESLQFKSDDNIVVLDDDSSIHQIWDKRFSESKLLDFGVKIFHFSTAYEVNDWMAHQKMGNDTTFLFDFELLGQKETGLSVIEKLGLANQAILVTSRFEEKSILAKCSTLGVKLIPKSMAESVPIEILIHSKEKLLSSDDLKVDQGEILPLYDAVYLDDDKYLRWGWESSSKNNGIRLLALANPDELNNHLHQISKSTPIYIDRELGDDFPKGEVVAQELFAKGFNNLFLATGYDKDHFPKMDFIKDVIGKDAPWQANS